MEERDIELNKITQIAKSYKKEGYNVTIKPKASEIPKFIKEYTPDIIARSKRDNVVIEVKRRRDLATIDRIKNVADIVNKKNNWRFELIVTTSKRESADENKKKDLDLDLSEIQENLQKIKDLTNQGLLEAAFIIGWANLESISRQILQTENKNLTKRSSIMLIKTLFSLGYLTRLDYESLERVFQVRNSIIHGYKVPELNKSTVNRIVTINNKLLKEKQFV